MKEDATMASDVRWFFKHAGYSYDPKTETPTQGRWRCAREAVKAEKEFHARGWTFALEPDECHDWSDTPDGADAGCCDWCNEPLNARGECRNEHYVYGAVLRDESGAVLASIWGVVDPDTAYERVLRAELASEALANEAHAAREDARVATCLAL